MTDLYKPLCSLKEGHWFKLICGASFQHLPAVRNLTLAYALAGADCIDVAADPAVIAAAQEALEVAKLLAVDAQQQGFAYQGSPWLMVSLNDGEDPHFRKAEFNPEVCPVECPRPCEKICPAKAIVFDRNLFSGVVQDLCYGCGRCIPICPNDLIYTRSYVATPGAIAPLVLSTGVDALEIHTQVGRITEFKRLWQGIKPWVNRLKLIAISCPDGDGMIDYLWNLHSIIAPLPCPLIWQTDGRPMSGDIGDGTTLAAVKLSQKVLAAGLPGYVQLAGGTNDYTVAKLRAIGLMKRSGDAGADLRFRGQRSEKSNNYKPKVKSCPSLHAPRPSISGIAYGSYARALLLPILEQLDQMPINQDTVVPPLRLEDNQKLLWQAVKLANSLVSQLKSV
ncbi:circadian clock protein LdpA [Gloeocapsopsis sp. IPPAS B-1203]|uniref:circadian clock protein LdpA n=1 Tax=Gloeocapsopsis sp. IPPAS B-1203 TaxID=2049454 RepID=UPI000C19A36E|nr:LdpA C-terminal domain-containing domain [Gloeocapsopsis sp. IPPAS B-1203]PIG93263.1 4Fe-4S ferredoxin [Gloeocapsopsis sp. IPPAS B-1203]